MSGKIILLIVKTFLLTVKTFLRIVGLKLASQRGRGKDVCRKGGQLSQ